MLMKKVCEKDDWIMDGKDLIGCRLLHFGRHIKMHHQRSNGSSLMLVLPPEYSSRLFKSSFLTVASVYTAAQNELWDCFALTLLVLLTSINYWRYPLRGWRRNVDMMAVFMSMLYHFYLAQFATSIQHQCIYYLFVLPVFGCYFMARSTTDKNVSSRWHMVMHLMGNIANCFLYTRV